jgi:hypothetical protein
MLQVSDILMIFIKTSNYIDTYKGYCGWKNGGTKICNGTTTLLADATYVGLVPEDKASIHLKK